MWSLLAVLFSMWGQEINEICNSERKRTQRKENLLVSSLICLVKICFKRSEHCTVLYKNNLQPSKQLVRFLRSVCPANSLLPWWAFVSVTFGHQ